MRIVAMAGAVVLIFAAAASAGDAAVSKPTLNSMGLAEMQPLSDADGQAVRGKGNFSGVWGTSLATWGGQTSSNSYAAGSSWLGKNSSAFGNSLSFSGNFQFSQFSW